MMHSKFIICYYSVQKIRIILKNLFTCTTLVYSCFYLFFSKAIRDSSETNITSCTLFYRMQKVDTFEILIDVTISSRVVRLNPCEIAHTVITFRSFITHLCCFMQDVIKIYLHFNKIFCSIYSIQKTKHPIINV